LRAILVHQFGGPDVLQPGPADLPVAGPDELLVRVLAAGVGPWDVALRRGGWTGSLPYIPGGEFADVVTGDEGAGVGFDDGTPVYGYPGLTGCYAEYVRCPVERLAPVPAALNAVEAAAVPIDGLTAGQGLTDILGAGPGNQILITAGAGGLGHFGVQIARALGAEVVATASPSHHDFVHRLGAAVVVDHTVPGWPDEVRKVTDGGAGKVLACAAATLDGAARAARTGATIATPVHAPLPGSGEVHWRQYDGASSGSRLVRMAPWFDNADLSVHLSGRHYWQDAAAAHRLVERGHTRGKIALIVDDDLAAAAGV
jgi:NADPH:quinone reductase-like Zn-dependent oxidoreductase